MKPMKGRAIFVLLGLAAFGVYSVGRQSPPVNNVPVPAIISSPSALAQPVAYIGPAAQASAPALSPGSSAGLTPPKANVPDKPAAPDTKRKVETVLTAAAIAAIIVQASRDQYHARGRTPPSIAAENRVKP
jgi:hypothetical protein